MNEALIRIRTKVGAGRVSTIYFNGKWITISNNGHGRSSSTDADSLLEAGQNHLAACSQLQHKLTVIETKEKTNG